MDIFTTMITPYNKDGSVDYATAEKYVDWYFENGLTGIFAICQSSEIFFLSLDERVRLNKVVYDRAKALEKKSGRKFTVVSSGHISDTIEDQARELCAVGESGTDALILITNRLDPNNEGDDVFIKNTEELISKLPKEAKLGLYECPHPYKRLVTPKILDWCVSTGRFAYMKDTCCDAAVIKERCEQEVRRCRSGIPERWRCWSGWRSRAIRPCWWAAAWKALFPPAFSGPAPRPWHRCL